MSETKEKAKKNAYDKALTAYNQAMKLFHKGNFQKAVESLQAFLEKHSSEKELVDRVKIYLNICEKRLKNENIILKSFEDYYQFGVYKLNKHEFSEALKAFEKALEMHPKEGKVMYSIANVYHKMGQNDECLEFLMRAVKTDKFFSILARNELDFEDLHDDKKFNLITRMT